jgi:hypothetical protein
MKSQIPTSNIQRSSNGQALKPKVPGLTKCKYPGHSSLSWEMKEGANGNVKSRHAFDLEERTAKFGEAVVRFSKKIPRDATNIRLISQVVGCGTSVGQIIARQTKAFRKKISDAALAVASKRRKRRNSF